MGPEPSKGETITLNLHAGTGLYGSSAVGLPFNVYCHGIDTQSGMQSATYAVAAGDTLNTGLDISMFRESVYDVSVHAPNGFYRRYKGKSKGLRIHAACEYLRGTKKDLVLRLTNRGDATVHIASTITGQGGERVMKVAAGQNMEIVFDLTQHAMWYDVVLTSSDDDSFLWHFAGRVETGHPGQTDPAMGSL